jgi:hypothetical protein
LIAPLREAITVHFKRIPKGCFKEHSIAFDSTHVSAEAEAVIIVTHDYEILEFGVRVHLLMASPDSDLLAPCIIKGIDERSTLLCQRRDRDHVRPS